MKKKSLVWLLVLALSCFMLLAGCGSDSEKDAGDIKAGFICLHDENSTYDLNFINAAKEACENLGIEYEIKTNIPGGQECYDAAAELVDSGCGIVFADSFGHEDYMIQAAKEFPDVQFCHSTGTKAHTEGVENYHNSFASIYQGRFLAGVAAGMKVNEMIKQGKIKPKEAKVGYIGAFTYAEVVSGYTSFYLGVKHECKTATMDVTFTGSWYDETAEKEAANKLMDRGCVLISQHADSMGAPTACEKRNVPNVSYNGSTVDSCPNTFIVSTRINWVPYYEYAISAAAKGEAIETDYVGNLETKSVQMTEVNEKAAAEGTADRLKEVQETLASGDLQVFDTSTFTVKGKELKSYKADVDTDPDYKKDTEVIKDGYFHESEYRSAPYFDLNIDGIKLLDTKF